MSTGNGARLINVNRQSTKNMNNKIEMIDSRSDIIGIRPSEKMSFTDSISLMVRVVNVPMGV